MLSFRMLQQQIRQTARQLQAHGVGREDRVALVLPNGPEAAACFLAVAGAAVAAPLNPGYRAPEFDFYLADLRARAVIVPADSDGPALAVARDRGLTVLPLEIRPAAAGMFSLPPTAVPDAPEPLPPPRPEDVALVLHTSGTTSRPKLVPLTHGNLCASAGHIAATLGLSPDDRYLNVMPLFHIHGLAMLLASLASGGCTLCTEGFVAPRFFAWLTEHRPTWYSAVPTIHQSVLARARAERPDLGCCSLRLVRSSSSALPPPVAEGLEALFGVPAIEAYGMTEAAHQMCCNPLPPRARKFGSVGPAAGPEVAIMAEQGHLLPPGQTGEVVIRGPNVTPGYEADPEANARAFKDGWFCTGDLGRLDSEGYLFLTGRSKEIINRGGETIAPREVEEVLLLHPAAAQAVAFAVPDERLGEEVAAAVVLTAKGAATERELIAFAAERLTDAKVPRRVVLVEEIPKGPTGKLQRIGLAAALGLSGKIGEAEAEFVEPRDETEAVLCEVWREVLRVERVGIRDNFFDLGGDSILAAQVIGRVRARMSAELPMRAFFESPTVEAMARSVLAAPDMEQLLSELRQLPEEEARRLLEG
jgi:acyl-CoA synthetase (AMP-forming)/AMP-acid ligase II/acyl carrier protein